MKLAIDSSAFAKRYVKESGSDRLHQILQNATDLALSALVVPEIISGLQRRVREHYLSPDEYMACKKQMLDDVRDATILQITSSVVLQSVKLLEANKLRAMDALHIACALEWQADLFLTADKRQYQAAVKTGLVADYIGPPVHFA